MSTHESGPASDDTHGAHEHTRTTSTIILGGGCFWCIDAVYRSVEGVISVRSGYAGGHHASPSYEQVCTGATGHAEVVAVEFDPATVGLRDLLGIFFAVHDPTTVDRQGADVGTQYRSIVFVEDSDQESVVRDVIAEVEAQDVWGAPLVTQVRPLDTFWPAEAYHQNFFARNPTQGYCMAVVAPKVAKFRSSFSHLLASG